MAERTWTDPTRHRQLEELDLVELCTSILRLSRNELYVNMHFLDVALSSLFFEADPTISLLGTDGFTLKYHPEQLCRLYKQGRIRVNRAYLHSVLHCLFCHLDHCDRRVKEYWDLACDIAMESIIDGMHDPCVHVPPSPYRRDIYLRLRQKMKVLTAEGIYKVLQEMDLDKRQYERMVSEFRTDSHELWYEEDAKKQSLPRQSRWKDNREKIQTEIEAAAQERSDSEKDDLLEQVQVSNRERYDYRRFLRKFAVLKEEMQIDEDSFDYIYYTYGMEHYGNMPLIEPLESKEVFRVEDFVIVIDTSMSCSGELVRRFLEETYDVLSQSESYFKKVNIRIIQCDDQIRSDVFVSDQKEMEAYMQNLTLKGMGGTDFRPAFEYVESLRRQGAFAGLRGLLYFTDGKGVYPAAAPPYDVAFVFVKDQYEDVSVPSWAMKLILGEEDLEGSFPGNA